MAYNRRAHGRTDDSAGVSSSTISTRKADKQKWYDESRKPGDHNAKYLSKLKDMKEQLQKEEANGAPATGKGDHSRHRTHPPTRPGLTRHFSVNLPVFVTSADFASVPRAGRLSMYAKPGKHMPAIHPIQGVGLLDDPHGSRKGLKRNEQNTKRHNSLTPLEKLSQGIDKGSQPPTMKRFARSQKHTQPSFTHLHRNAPESASSMTSAHVPRIGRLRSRSTCNEYDTGVSSTHAHSFARASDKHGVVLRGKPSSKYKADYSSSRESSSSRKVGGLELAPMKRSITVDVPTGKNEADYFDQDSSGYRAPVSTPLTEAPDQRGSHSDTMSVRSGLHRQNTTDSDDWSEVGVTLSQIRLSHSQSEPSIKDYVAIMADEDSTEVDLPRVDVKEHRGTVRQRGRSVGSEEGIPVVQINSRSEAENEAQLENTVTISAPFIMFRPATPRMPEPEEKTHDHEIGRVLVKAATQAELRRKEMRRLLEDINEFNSANKNLYRKVKVHPLSS